MFDFAAIGARLYMDMIIGAWVLGGTIVFVVILSFVLYIKWTIWDRW